MAKAKFDIKTLELPPIAAKPLYAGVGVTDLAVELVRDYVADVQEKFVGYQKDVQKIDVEPKALRDQAVSVVNDNVTTLTDTVTDTYGDRAKRGEALVTRIRKQEATKATRSSAKTTTAKAKTTKTQGAKATRTTAKKATTTAKKSSGPARSCATATTTAATKTVSNAAQAATDAAEKVGD